MMLQNEFEQFNQLGHLNLVMPIILGLLALFGVLFYQSYRKNRVRLLNGYLASIIMMLLGVLVTVSLLMLRNPVFFSVWVVLLVILLIVLTIIFSLLYLILIINGLLMWYRESLNLANSLTLILGVALVIYPLIIDGLQRILPQWLMLMLNLAEGLLLTYFVVNFLAFMLSFLLLRLTRPKFDKDYIIVLGAGLINGREVSNLLASRIQRGIDFANRQISATGKTPYLILSGGQGGDEAIAEGLAMQAYVLEHQLYDADYILPETASKNTLENMLFSKQLMTSRNIKVDKGVFATSDYHVYRATGYALFAGLNISGLGAKTRKYFIPSALIREYIAILMQHKRFHLIMVIMILLIAIVVGVFTGYYTYWR
ncbi:YdcF family protein [Weissella diestrammenae]|uniref:YdcF family protein n=1 Tax=Weissella diestrammenae TaxID=1162633 RepID=A0A7G9T6X1_9LACO|nr:YdcF family protein [Weissella diestrammenae]MCM0582559.1 YdcF family protein [Weissella diestrammenae]QNN75846.1 YdcF family protein [Weissella diestrammenae]